MPMETILITGSGSGLGKLTALTLAKLGKKVIATTETQFQADLLKADAEALEIPLVVEKIDITDPADRKKAWEWDIDILVNNAAVKEGGALVDIPEENFRNQYEVNVFGTFLLTQGFSQKMINKGYGRIIFISSISGLMVNPFSGPYSSSKFAIEAIAKAFQQELQEFNIEVATINPGPFLTGFNDEEFERYRTWNDQPQTRIFNYKNLAFPFPQLRPKKAIAPIIKVILGKTKTYRNLVPRGLSVGIFLQEF
ncbi:MAG TPA: SDR family oxidoreductase, partial [Candidatus Atopostipes pullistercoris]|nr:SDR family oxidoreductase [Candidatus Atopostipes pullistercoris]